MISIPNDPPRHEHDCDKCVYLGRLNDDDLYYCPGKNSSYILRHSSDGPDYSSFADFFNRAYNLIKDSVGFGDSFTEEQKERSLRIRTLFAIHTCSSIYEREIDSLKNKYEWVLKEVKELERSTS